MSQQRLAARSRRQPARVPAVGRHSLKLVLRVLRRGAAPRLPPLCMPGSSGMRCNGGARLADTLP
jgi:hypothetical protein